MARRRTLEQQKQNTGVAHSPPVPTGMRSSEEPQQQQKSKTAEPRRRPKRSRNVARERMQSELKQLRALSGELEQHRNTLQQQQRDKRPHSPEEIAMLTAWEYIVNCQLRERIRAEEENAQLRDQVQSQLAVLRKLQQAGSTVPGLLDQVSSILASSSEALFDLRNGPAERSPIVLEDDAVYETLISEADAAFLRMESIFRETGLSAWWVKDASELWTQAQVKTQRSSQIADGAHCIELIHVDMFPFSKESVFRAMCQCWEQQYMAKNCDVYEMEHLPCRNDTVVGRMRYVELVDGERMPLEFQFVLKLFVVADRICYVCRSTAMASTSVAEIVINETWWEEMRTVPALDGDANSFEGTLTLSCSQVQFTTLTTRSPDCLDATAVATPLLADAVISSYEADIVDVTCRMMDVLLEETGATLTQAV